jgi:hypothetical protein
MDPVENPSPRRAVRLLVLVLAALGAACDRSPTEAEPPLAIVDVILAGTDGTYAFSHTDHWHGAPVVHAGQTATYTVHFTSRRMPIDDHEPPPVQDWFTLEQHPEYTFRVVIEDPTVATWGGNRAVGELVGLRAGSSRLSIVVLRGTTTVYEAPPLNFRVQEAQS